MLILGIIDSKPAAAALLRDGEIVSAVAEERLCRMKLAGGMPRRSIAAVLESAGAQPGDVELTAVAQCVSEFVPSTVPWSSRHAATARSEQSWFDSMSARLAPVVGRWPATWEVHHRLRALRSRARIRGIPQLLRDELGLTAPVVFHDHHACHAASAVYTSGFSDCLAVTFDGGGDGRSGSVYELEDGRLRSVASVDSFNSLGNLYGYVTELCGFSAERHEGKVTGLAACGSPDYADVLRDFVAHDGKGRIRYLRPMYQESALRMLRAALPGDLDRAKLAASVQLVLEEVVTSFVRHWLRATGHGRLAVAGGVFANVKLNQRLHEMEEVDELWVHPAMDDGGLAVGAAMLEAAGSDRAAAAVLARPMPHAYLGPVPEAKSIETAAREAGVDVRLMAQPVEEIAELLAAGAVVARFTGRMEYGPRALGHRSILYRTDDPTVNDWLNERLDRTEFMPFAPATLVEHADACYPGLDGARDAARFMTVTFSTTERMRQQSPGVVHVDGTARPQIVDAETSPDLHAILSAYHARTGIPSLVNTSFNLHEEPIVCTPADAVRAFLASGLDHLAMDDCLLSSPSGRSARRVSS